MTQFTRGPWHASLDAKVYGAGTEWNKGLNADLPPFVASVGGNTAAQANSNARLIAAAPDLLEALRALCDAISLANEFKGADLAHPQAIEFNDARAAIAKATGE